MKHRICNVPRCSYMMRTQNIKVRKCEKCENVKSGRMRKFKENITENVKMFKGRKYVYSEPHTARRLVKPEPNSDKICL